MRQTIWKFPVTVEDEFSVPMPPGAKVLSVHMQHGEPCMWAIVNSDSEVRETRHFCVRGTGHRLTGVEGRFVGTFLMREGALVFHLFERTGDLL